MMADKRVLFYVITVAALLFGMADAGAEWVRIGELKRTVDGPDYHDVTVDRTISRLRLVGLGGMIFNKEIEVWAGSAKSRMDSLGVVSAGKAYASPIPGGTKRINRLRIRNSGDGRYAVEVDTVGDSPARATTPVSPPSETPLAKLAREAGAGEAKAQYTLGCAYYLGDKGVARDYAQAFAWYLKAAKQGHRTAQEAVANLYYKGDGVARDYAQSLFWSRKAADQGSVVGYYNLAVAYEDGNAVAKDLDEAARWYRKAADQGDKESAAWLKAHPQIAAAAGAGSKDSPPPARRPDRPPVAPPVSPPPVADHGAGATNATYPLAERREPVTPPSPAVRTPVKPLQTASAKPSAATNQSNRFLDSSFKGFPYDAPCNRQYWTMRGVPWKVASEPAGNKAETNAVIPVHLPSFSFQAYQGLAGRCKEAIRLIYGTLNAEEARTFELLWAPFFDFPNEACFDYFGKLLPLLDEYHRINAEALGREQSLRDNMDEAGLRAFAGDELGARTMLDSGYRQVMALKEGKRELERTVGKIQILGDPPNPLQLKCRARKQHKDVVKEIRRVVPPKQEFVKGWWVLKERTVENALTNKTPEGFVGYPFALEGNVAESVITRISPPE